MVSLIAASALLGLAQNPHGAPNTRAENPDLLNIGLFGFSKLEYGWTDLRTENKSSLNEFVVEARKYKFVFLGELHTQAEHHQVQAQVIDALAKDGRNVVVGFEMFTRPVQPNLAPWSMGWWTKEEFIEKADWKGQWGFDFSLYEPIFNVVREHKLPMVALNVPRDWVRAVGRGGPSALTEEQKRELPALNLNNKDHKRVFFSLIGGHPEGASTQMENMYAAQVLWDEGMADTAIKWIENKYGSVKNMSNNVVFVILAGSGHGLYKQGINWRIKQRTGLDSLTLNMFEGEPRQVSRGIADFAYLAPTPKK